MPANSYTAGTLSTGEPDGIISGALLREIRRRLGYRQDQFAELLGVELDTYRSWENGRRPLTRVSTHKLRKLVQGLLRIGADAELVALLDTAIDVDLNIAEVLTDHIAVGEHPLATRVQTRAWHDLFTWAIAGRTPRILHGAGEASTPRMSVPVRNRLLEQLRDAAEQAETKQDPASTLLRRQVYFLASVDTSGPGRDWLTRMERRELSRLRAVDGWTPNWVAGRSIAVAKAVAGDPDQLRHFIATHIVDDGQEIANLNYWANWSGEDARPAQSDEFMRTPDLGRWRGTELLRQLTDGLRADNPYLDLTVHTVWALLQRRSGLLGDDPLLTQKLDAHVRQLIDTPAPLSDQARRELDQINYGATMRRTA